MILNLLLAATAFAAPQPAGVIVMAHGGDAAWDRAVHDTVAPLESRLPVELAFGMADPESLQAAVTRLESRGVRRIAVVRLFINGESFLTRTRKILGVEPGAPPKPAAEPGHEHHGHGGQGGHRHGDPDSMPLWRVETKSRIVVDAEGLVDSELAGRILAERAAALSRDPANEAVLVLAHGAGDEAENDRWRARMERFTETIRGERAFRDVRAETLREDWPESRRAAEARIRGYVAAGAKSGGAIVVPFRVYGFGPYAEVLKGLTYASDGLGLIPHTLVGQWVSERVTATFEKAGWTDAL
ncbi:MAG: hypothetical protein HY553_05700 [Elusimicrobia bacterium]|nr:hypothetical protein [Elusimicrobiota bacterium]